MLVVEILVPSARATEFREIWNELIVAEGITGEVPPVAESTIRGADGTNETKFTVQVYKYIAPIIGAIFGYVAALRGEFIFKDGDKIYEFRNLKPSQVEEFLALVREHEKKR